MLGFLFQSSMVMVMLAALAMMIAFRRHKKYAKVTKWLSFACALIAGSALSATILGDWLADLATGLVTLLGAPAAAVGILALFGVLVVVLDLLDKQPDGAARTMALVLPTLLLATGGQLGLFGAEFTGGVAQGGSALVGSLIGLGG